MKLATGVEGVLSASPDSVALNRARSLFVRVSDSKSVRGWVSGITPETIVVSSNSMDGVNVGDEFLCYVFGNKLDAFFRAKLSLQKQTGPEPEYLFQLSSKMCFQEAKQAPRFRVDGLVADLEMGEKFRDTGARVLDIGWSGFAALTGRGLSIGDQVTVKLVGKGVLVPFIAEVRNCSDLPDNPKLQRTGFETKLDRLGSASWKQIFLDVLSENQIHWVNDPLAMSGTNLRENAA